MKNFMVDLFEKFYNMSESERISYLIPLSIKEQNGTLSFIEMMEIATIQSIREMNGEIEKVKQTNEIMEELKLFLSMKVTPQNVHS